MGLCLLVNDTWVSKSVACPPTLLPIIPLSLSYRRNGQKPSHSEKVTQWGAVAGHLPHGVHVSGGQAWAADGGAVVGPHDPFCQEKIPKQTSHQQVLSEELLEEI